LLSFRSVWRMNGILILVGSLALFGLAAFAIFEKYRQQWAYDEVHSMVNIEPEVKAGWDLGSFERVHGSDYLVAPVFSRQSYRVRTMEKDVSAIRNYLLLKESDKSTRWVVRGNETLVLSCRQYSADGEWLSGAENKKAAQWLLLEVVAKDSNGDRRLSDADRRSVVLSDLQGTRYLDVVPAVDEILTLRWSGPKSLLAIYREEDRYFVKDFDVSGGVRSLVRELPRLGVY
jgi:hypothetical protein